MASNKLFQDHEKARAAAESAARKYAEFLKDTGKGREKDDAGNKAAQSGRVKRALRGSK